MINSVLKKTGSWSVAVDDSMPSALLEEIQYFGHLAFIPGRINPADLGDNTLDLARYVGIVRSKTKDTISGIGLAGWLGDEDKKGAIYETAVVLNGATFPNSIRALLPPAVSEGTLYSAPGTYTHVHRYEDPRTAIDYVCDTFGADWRLTNRCELDAGLTEDLFVTDPTSIIVRKGAGSDLHMRALPGDIDSTIDAKDFTTRVVLLAEGDGFSIATASANNTDNPYKDMLGNPVQLTRLVSESSTSTGSAQSRAQLALNQFTTPQRSVSLSADEFDIAGDLTPGDYVWVYDPETGLFDTDNEIVFRGQILNPVKIRIQGVSFPVEAGSTVAYRSPEGEWTDLTDFIKFETGSTTIDVGDNLSTQLVSNAEAVRPRVAGDTTPPAPPAISSITTQSYLAGDGQTKARLTISWNLPLNVDGSTIVDGDSYIVRWRIFGGSIYYQFTASTWSTRTITLNDLSNGTTYEVSVEAVDTSGNHSGYGTDVAVIASADTIPPSTPAPPVVAGNPLAIQVKHTLGKSTGGIFNLENDLDSLFVYADPSPTFTPAQESFVGKIAATNGNLQQQIPALGGFPVTDGSTKWVKVIAVDASGNKSLPSAAAQATALLIDTINVQNAAITTALIGDAQITNAKVASLSADKITAGTINANVIVGQTLATGTSGVRVVLRSDQQNYMFFETGDNAQQEAGYIYGVGFFPGTNQRHYQLTVKAPTISGGTFLGSAPYLNLRGHSFDQGSYLNQATLAADQTTYASLSGGSRLVELYADGDTYARVDGGGNEIQLNASSVTRLNLNGNGGGAILQADNNAKVIVGGQGVRPDGLFASLQSKDDTSIECNLNAVEVFTGTSDTYFRVYNGGYLSLQVRQQSGYTVVSAPNLPTSSSDPQMRYSTSSGQFFVDASSRRFKQDIHDFDERYDISDIDKVRVVSYRETDKMTGEDKRKNFIGVIAEELDEVFPAFVSLDDDGVPHSVNYDKMSALNTRAIQDLRDRLKRLEEAS